MKLSNQLLRALKDFDKMRGSGPYGKYAPNMADLLLCADLVQLELNRTAQDKFDRPIPVRVRINKETGAIEV